MLSRPMVAAAVAAAAAAVAAVAAAMLPLQGLLVGSSRRVQ
jgi:hypothetical protein